MAKHIVREVRGRTGVDPLDAPAIAIIDVRGGSGTDPPVLCVIRKGRSRAILCLVPTNILTRGDVVVGGVEGLQRYRRQTAEREAGIGDHRAVPVPVVVVRLCPVAGLSGGLESIEGVVRERLRHAE